MINLIIDGKTVEAEPGDTVLQAAQKAGIEIPALCAHPDLEPYGACRMCVVEIEGLRGLPTSCTTPATEGMVVRTTTPAVLELRRNVLKLMLSGHTSPCLVCLHKDLCEKYRPNPAKAGTVTRCESCSSRPVCELRKLTQELDIDDLDLPVIYRDIPLERNDPFMDRDYSLCILCGRCVRICAKLHGKPAISFVGRGAEARIGTEFAKDHTDTNCTFCGACVDICPVGALTDRHAKWHGEPDAFVESRCILCPIGCPIMFAVKDNKIVGARARSFRVEDRICAIGRFVLPQLFQNPTRLTAHHIQTDDGRTETPYPTAVARAAEELARFTGDQFALLAHTAATREELVVLKAFTRDVMKSDNFGVATSTGTDIAVEPTELLAKLRAGSIKALLCTGSFLDDDVLSKLDCLVVTDVLPSDTSAKATVAFAASVLAETSGTFRTAADEIGELAQATAPPPGLAPDWKIVCDIATAMKADGFSFENPAQIRDAATSEPATEPPPAMPTPSPLDELSALPPAYRGHPFTDISCALSAALGTQPAAKPEEQQGEGFLITAKQELVPNTHMITVQAPDVAKYCKPGQFVIAMVNAKSERIPYSLADWDKDTVTINVLEAGRSSSEILMLKKGDRLAHFAGPLGNTLDIRNYGTVVCGGGCYGVGAMLPLARAFKAAGNKVICIEEASSAYLLYWQERLAAECDEFVIMTKDGTAGHKGGVQEAIARLVDRGEKLDQAFICGCTFMMMLTCEVTKELGIPTMTAMNPLMLDGTGMCGACRVSVGGETKFACVDGPFLDGHQIDWEQLFQRQRAFGAEEIQALPQEYHAHHPCREA